MERRPDDLDVGTITIDEAKERYILTKSVRIADGIEVIRNNPRFILSYNQHGAERYAMIGPNLSDRYLLTAIAQVVDDEWRVVSAYWLRSRRGQRLYEGG